MNFENSNVGKVEKVVQQDINSDDKYTRLGIRRDSTPQQVESAYMNLLKTLDPSVGGNPDDYKRLVEAYDELMLTQTEDGDVIASKHVEKQLDTQKNAMAEALAKIKAAHQEKNK